MAIEKKIDFRGHNIFYRISGRGKPLVWIHGFGETSDVWSNQLNWFEQSSLQDRYLLIIPDIPGSGRSEMIDDMSMEGMAEVLEKILANESPLASKAVMIGHSMGGYIMLAFIEKWGNRLDAFGLFHSTAYADSEEKKAIRRKGIGFIQEHGAFEFLKSTAPNLFSSFTKKDSPGMIEGFIQSLSDSNPKALIAYYESMIARPDRSGLLKSSGMPALFIIGEEDNAVPPKDMLEQSHLPVKSFIHILTRSGHMGMMEEKEKSNQILEEFLGTI